ncbi:MAG: PaaI family thioesterase [Piscinibacter sp.]|uniref:PaaI family thioesterase n=1 Tax=Piscinibacter sp. TaxID=1903157 RepID=UPI00258B50BE|nr:PaaI family thioesterase [Piscinibacter sp.]MCW5664111.1 PaaI family thioesterase [Piscinibacter sp.]
MENGSSTVDRAMLEHALHTVFAPWVQQLDLRVIDAQAGEVLLALPVTPQHVHVGNVVSGQTLMAAADTAMVLAVMTRAGGFKPMSTVQLQTSFLRPVPAESGVAQVRAKVLRMGRSLVFGEVRITTADEMLAAHATTTCALL